MEERKYDIELRIAEDDVDKDDRNRAARDMKSSWISHSSTFFPTKNFYSRPISLHLFFRPL